MDIDVELCGGPCDGDRFSLVAAEDVLPPAYIYMPRSGDAVPFAGPPEGEPKVLNRLYHPYRHTGRVTVDGREIYAWVD